MTAILTNLATLADVLGVAEQLLSSRVDLARQDAEARLGVGAGGDVTADETYGLALEALGAWGAAVSAVRAAGLAGAATGVIDGHQAGPVSPRPSQAVDIVDAAIWRTDALGWSTNVWRCSDGFRVSVYLVSDDDLAVARQIFAALGAPDPVLSDQHGHTLAHLYGPVPSLGDAVLRVAVRVGDDPDAAAGGAR